MLQDFEQIERVIIGVDLGQAQDFTAIAGIEVRQRYKPIKIRPGGFEADYGRYVPDGENYCMIRFLERLPLGTPYPDQVRRVETVFRGVEQIQRKAPSLVVDATGCGRPVFDMFKEANLKPKGITIHGGNNVSTVSGLYNVPKRDLVGVLQVLFQNGRIKISGRLPERETLERELLNFKVKINIKGHDSYEAWRENEHDDLVLAVAVGCWFSERGFKKVKSFPKDFLGI